VTYLPLVWFRSPSYEASWVTSLLAVLDSAALYLSLCPLAAPAVPARLCLRSGLLCFSKVARSMGIMSRLRTRSPRRLTPSRLSGLGRGGIRYSRCRRCARCLAFRFPSWR
jgi:hypothetical protein